MKTVRTRVRSAFKRNSKGTPAAPSEPAKLPAASTSAPSILHPENDMGITAPPSSPVTGQNDEHFPGFRLETEPETDLAVANNKEQKNALDITRLKFTGDEPEHIYASQQPIILTGDSRRSTPKKRIKSVPRLSSDDLFPSPSIASRITTQFDDAIVSDIKFVSPVDPNYLIDDIRGTGPSLLDQPAPTDASFVDLTPKEVPSTLPPLHEILAHQAQLRRMDSSIDVAHRPPDPDTHQEDKPLLESSLLTVEVDDILDSVWPLPPQTFPSLGWTEHVLPSSSYYYSHAATRTVTDIDLRDEKKLAAVKSYLKLNRSSSAGVEEGRENGNGNATDDNTIRKAESTLRIEEGIDLWLRDANPGLATTGGSEWEFMPMRNWVLHATRAVTFDPPSEYHATTEDLSDQDRLDLENRYWQYMSTHPAHASLPQSAYEEALEVLTWCYSDQVLRIPQPVAIPSPFTQKECVDLLELLRNLTALNSSPNQIVRTRLIAQILLRYTEWRQKYVAKSPPEKLTSLSGRPMEAVEHAIPFQRTILHFVKAVVCLGVPYLFESPGREGWNSNRLTDEEEQAGMGAQRPGDIVMGSGQPLVAALLLSTSVTMLVLPELNGTSRTAALISALCAASSLVSFVITLNGRDYRLRMQKTSLGRSYSAILASLPLVMLAYALCAFLIGVIAYSIAGSDTTSRNESFGKYTGWVVIAVWIALAAVLATSAAVTKKGQ
ncbi:hypothetical protein JB92DRAFT_2863754 [Gautieria morchelliformis]|nr:hypothetical protein JB92DRAFT_2863754 [Gautieria morchelliformis]